MSDADAAARAIREHGRFLVVTHTNPDGDAVGAALGLTIALRKMGKDAVHYSQDAIPYFLDYLPCPDAVSRKAPNLAGFDVVFIVDCGEMARTGRIAPELGTMSLIINADHHASNPRFGHVNVVDENASSSSEIVYRILTAAGYAFDRDVATCLYTGIYSDTTSFRNTNSTPDAYRICGEMVAAGADATLIARKLYIEQPLKKALLFSRILPTLRVEPDGLVAGMVVENETMNALGAGSDALEGFVDYPMSIEGVQAAYLLREVFIDGRKRIKGSLRTAQSVDATVVTGRFGGGGHRRAAGFTADGTLDSVRLELIGRIRESLSLP